MSKKHHREGHEHHHREEGDDGRRKGEGNARELHEQLIAMRQGGGSPPSADAYARALGLWRQIPGAVRQPATYVKLLTAHAPERGGKQSSKPAHPGRGTHHE